MAVTAKVFSHLPYALANKLINLETDTIKCMLCTSTYAIDQDAHDFKDDVTNEVVGTGYTAGGAEAANPAVSIAAKVTKFDADDVQWVTSTITARYAVLYDNTPATDATKPLIAYVDFGENKVSDNGTFKLAWNASGIFTITVA